MSVLDPPKKQYAKILLLALTALAPQNLLNLVDATRVKSICIQRCSICNAT